MRALGILISLAGVMLIWDVACAHAATRLGLQVSAEELAVWRQRAVNGPYRSRGDVRRNSIDDWDRVARNKNEFLKAGHTQFWTPPGTGPLRGYVGGSGPSLKWNSCRVRDAAFYALIREDHAVKAMVRDWLLAQAERLDYSDRSRWPLNTFNREHLFQITNPMGRLVLAMDYIEILDRKVFTAEQRARLLRWFDGLAQLQYEAATRNGNQQWKDRYNGDYTPLWPNTARGIPFFGGDPMPKSLRIHNNRLYCAEEYLAIVGVHQSRPEYIAEAKLVVKEFLRFGVHPDGYGGDFDRWRAKDIKPDLGWRYAAGLAQSVVLMADVLARSGDVELYEYTTSAGLAGTEGHPKNILFVIQYLQKYVDGTYRRYGSDKPEHNGDPAYLVDDRDEARNRQGFHEGGLIPANLYYRNANVRTIYRREFPGAKEFLSSYDPQDVYLRSVAPYLMFADMEGTVWPYPGAARPPAAPVDSHARR